MTITDILSMPAIWVGLAGYVLALWPSGWIVAAVTRQWQAKIREELPEGGLPNAGRVIGYLERIIIVTLVIYGDFSAIGFLVAAKSLLRFGELSGRKDKTQTEYVLIGTLLSFALGMIIGIGITLVHRWWLIDRIAG